VREDLYQLAVLEKLDKQIELLTRIERVLLQPPMVVGVDPYTQSVDLQGVGIGTDGRFAGKSVSGKGRKR
jgi:hypothetical protein